MKRLLFVGCVALSACGSLPTNANVTAATAATISKAQADLQTAINLWGIAKGIGQVAALAEPALSPVVSTTAAFVDPIVMKAQAVINDTNIDVALIEALTAQLTAQANALTVKAAPKVTVVPNAPV